MQSTKKYFVDMVGPLFEIRHRYGRGFLEKKQI